MRRAEIERGLLLEGDGVDGDDVPRTSHPSPLHRVDAHSSDSHDDHRFPRHDLRPVDRRAPAGGHPARDEGHHAQRNVRVHLYERGLVDDAVLGERPDLGHDVEVAPAQAIANRPVGDLTRREGGRTEIAQVGVAGDAHPAATADRKEARRDVVARLDAVDARPDSDDDPPALVAPHHGKEPRVGLLGHVWRARARPHVARPQVLVRVAQTCGRPLDEDFLVAGRIEIDLLDLPVLVPAPQDRRTCFHHLYPLISERPRAVASCAPVQRTDARRRRRARAAPSRRSAHHEAS